MPPAQDDTGGRYSTRKHISFPSEIPSESRTERLKRFLLSHSLQGTLDRVKALGENQSGHTGCVNALSWAANGELLLSGGDDRTVRIWKMDPSDTTTQYPFVCQSLIHTGHRANIFNAQILPGSSQLVTVAGDHQVRVFDAEEAVSRSSGETEYATRRACTRVLQCHTDRCKRIVTEGRPDLFLTVAEDGCVRQHDLRTSHTCGSACPSPLIKLNHSLSTIALSPLTPYQFVVAGQSPYGYLFDRRHTGRLLNEEWGKVPAATENDMATCVRRFGRPSGSNRRRRNVHITGARMSANNGYEVLLSYSCDAVYLYSTQDSPTSDQSSDRPASILSSKTQPPKETTSSEITSDPLPFPDLDPASESDDDLLSFDEPSDAGQDKHGEPVDDPDYHPKVPVVLPRRRFGGARNVETVKDVNFLGPNDEYVTSGSDDGNFFMWRKDTGKVVGVYEGDNQVVNVIEDHPHLPLIAVSGIDKTVKLFAPIHGKTSHFSRMSDLEAITQRNARQPMITRTDIFYLIFRYHRFVLGSGRGETDGTEDEITSILS